MLFNSLIFLFVFLPITLLGWYTIKGQSYRLLWITILSLVFYAYWNWMFIGLLLLSIGIDYYCGLRITRHVNTDNKLAKKWMITSIISNLLILGFFKYCDFFIKSVNLLSFLPSEISYLNIILPVGISFYTFQSMSYSIDLYRGDAKPANSFLTFSAYVTLFPQMIAGPIVRYKSIAEQINNISKTINWNLFKKGLFYLAIGLFRKVIIADNFAKVADPFFDTFLHFDHAFIISWLGLLSYTFQIYFDFSAYSEMAIGLGLMLGFKFPVNFNSPYRAVSFSDFWTRWHITLSEFLRDNLYIPLGGNRNGNINTYKFLLITMLLGGLWHGASWMFIIWGLLHGIYLTIERLIFGKIKKRNFIYSSLVFFFVCITWIFFRSPNMDTAIGIVKSCFLFNGIESLVPTYELLSIKCLPTFTSYIPFKHIAAITLGLFTVMIIPNTNVLIERYNVHNKSIWVPIIIVIFIVDVLFCFKNSPFIYFQF